MKQTEFIRRLTDVMEGHKQRLFRYACYRTGSVAEAQDILQDLYLRLLERHHEVEKAANLPAYIFRSLANACSSRTIAPHYVDLSSSEVALLDSDADNFEEEVERIRTLVAAMPEESREVIRLKIYAGLTFDEVAETLGFSSSTAKRRYYEGLESLRKKYNLL